MKFLALLLLVIPTIAHAKSEYVYDPETDTEYLYVAYQGDGSAISYSEFREFLDKSYIDMCEREAQEEFLKLSVQSAPAGLLCAGFTRAHWALGTACASYVGVQGWFAKRGIELRKKECVEDIDRRWRHHHGPY